MITEPEQSSTAGITLLARLTTADIIAARFRIYFGSIFGKIWTASGIVVPVLLWALDMAKSWEGIAWMPFMTLFAIPFGIAVAGIRSPEVREMIERGVSYRLSEQGIHWERLNASGDHGWPLVGRAWETKAAFVLSSGASLIIFPKRCFERPEDVEAVRGLIRQHVAAAALLS